jgi:hypothetical protein
MGAECDLRSMYSKFKRLTLGVQRDLEHARANENQLEEEHNQQIEVEVEVSAALQLGKRKKKRIQDSCGCGGTKTARPNKYRKHHADV